MTSKTSPDSIAALRRARPRAARGGILVLGGGFAGGSVARRLGAGGATIVNPTNFMLYTPLLPEAAAGTIEPRHVTVPLRTMCPHADLVLGAAVAHDPERRIVHVESEAGHFAIAYADLVVALGAVTRLPPVPGVEEHALQLKDLPDAIRLRNHVLRQIELADAAPETAAERLTFVLAGAGYAGVETVAELQELAAEALRRHRRLRDVAPRWVLVDGGPRILGQTPESLARFAARTLDRRGVEIVTGTKVTSVGATGVTLSDGRRIATRTTVWTAGVRPNPLLAELGLPLDERGRVPVDETLRVSGASHVWALGDCAAVPNEATPGVTDPATCQHALRQARRLARNLRGTPSAYRYRTRGSMATLGRRSGIAARRARVVADWALGAMFRRDVAELSVTPPSVTPPSVTPPSVTPPSVTPSSGTLSPAASPTEAG